MSGTSIKNSDLAKDSSSFSQDTISTQVRATSNVHRVTTGLPKVTSCRSYYGSSVTKIRDAVDQSSIPLTPQDVVQITGCNHSTVKKTLIRLERKGFVKKICYGYYGSLQNNVTLHGSRVAGESGTSVRQKVVEPRLHCLRLRASDVVGKALNWTRDFDVVRIYFERFKNGSAQVFVDCARDYSFDYVAFRLLLDVVLRELDVSDWSKMTVSSFEFNNDFEGVRLDGCQAVTLKSFDGSFRRLYNRKYGLRDEVKAVGCRRIEDVLAMLQGGVSNYNILQLLFMILSETRAERESIGDAAAQMHRLVDFFFEQKDKTGSQHD
jgi:hypothetical protein